MKKKPLLLLVDLNVTEMETGRKHGVVFYLFRWKLCTGKVVRNSWNLWAVRDLFNNCRDK